MPKVFAAGKNWVCRHITQPSGLFYKAEFPAGSSFSMEMPACNGTLTDMFRMVSGLETLALSIPEHIVCKVNYFAYSSTLRQLQLPAAFAVSDFTNFANRCGQLEEITGAFDLSQSSSNEGCFGSCTALREVRFVPGSILKSISFKQSNQLSAESVASILEGLGSVETAQTLTLHDTVRAQLTPAQIAAIEAKNWQLL